MAWLNTWNKSDFFEILDAGGWFVVWWKVDGVVGETDFVITKILEDNWSSEKYWDFLADFLKEKWLTCDYFLISHPEGDLMKEYAAFYESKISQL